MAKLVSTCVCVRARVRAREPCVVSKRRYVHACACACNRWVYQGFLPPPPTPPHFVGDSGFKPLCQPLGW